MPPKEMGMPITSICKFRDDDGRRAAIRYPLTANALARMRCPAAEPVLRAARDNSSFI
jgi:hypothetical protein